MSREQHTETQPAADGPPQPCVEVEGLCRNFASIAALKGISFRVQAGEILGFLGPNGAGKSTTMKIITGFLDLDAGTVQVNGHDVQQHPQQVKASIGYLPEGAPCYRDMTVQGFLSFIAEVRGFQGQEKARRVDMATQRLHLEKVRRQTIETLSKGYQRRVGFAQAILHDPPVLIMDEPTDGMDPNQKHEVRSLIRDMASDKVIIISTHALDEVMAVCTRVILIAEGRLLFDGSPAQFTCHSPSGDIEQAFRSLTQEPTAMQQQPGEYPG